MLRVADDLFIGRLGWCDDYGFALRFRLVLVLVVGFSVVPSMWRRAVVVVVVVVTVVVAKVPLPVNDAYILRCETLEEAGGEVQCAERTFRTLQRGVRFRDRNRERKHSTMSVIVAVAFLPLYSNVICLKQRGPGYPSPNWIAFKATMESESSFTTPHAPLRSKQAGQRGQREQQG